MSEVKKFILAHDVARQRALEYVQQAPDGYEVVIRPPKMSNGQKAHFHAICDDLRRSGLTWQGKKLTSLEWKLLLISGHSVATGESAEIITGLEGELINLREAITDMRKARGASLIEYALAYCVLNNVPLRQPKRLHDLA